MTDDDRSTPPASSSGQEREAKTPKGPEMQESAQQASPRSTTVIVPGKFCTAACVGCWGLMLPRTEAARRPGEGRRHVSLVTPATAAAPRDADPGNNRRPPHHTRGASGSTRAVRLSTLGLGLRRFCCVGTLARTRPSLLSPLSPAPAWRRHLATSTSPARRRKRAPAVCMVAGPTKKPQRINQIDRLMDQTIRFGPRKSTIRLRALSSSPCGVYWFGV